MPLTQFDHYTVRSRDIDASARFYADVMGLRVEALDGFAFPMRLLFLGDQAIAHLLGTGAALDAFLGRSAPSHAEGPARQTGNLEHMAFNGTDRVDFIARLNKADVRFTERSLADYGVHQLMFDDPDGVEIEVNFPLSEKPR